MSDWGFLSGLFGTLQSHSPMLGRFWLLLMLVFRMLILGTVASDMFDDEQEEFACNTLQPGCKQVCYDQAFPISQYRFWVFHIVLISTPSLVFLMYAMHHHRKRQAGPRVTAYGHSAARTEARQERHIRHLYILNVIFRLLAEVGFVIGQWRLYGFRVEAQFPCSRFPCPYTVDCFTSRPMEKTVFLCFYFAVGVLSAFVSFAELIHISCKWLWENHAQAEAWGGPEQRDGFAGGSYVHSKEDLAQGESRVLGKERGTPPPLVGSVKDTRRQKRGASRSSVGTKYHGYRSSRNSSGQKSSMSMV